MFISNTPGANRLSSHYLPRESNATIKSKQITDISLNSTDSVSISNAAKMLAENEIDGSRPASSEVQKQLDTIKAKSALERTNADREFLQKYDIKWSEISAKVDSIRTADEVDYMQKAGGFVNTMAYLSPKERLLYDELVSNGNTEALRGMSLIAMSRVGNENTQITLPGGKSFNPNSTEITSENIRNLFKIMFVDSSGDSDRSFDALASYLDQRDSS